MFFCSDEGFLTQAGELFYEDSMTGGPEQARRECGCFNRLIE